jgi:large subunit ribosomal protein L21
VFSIVECGGFQYKVSEGDVIHVPSMTGSEGDEVTLDKVLLVNDDSGVTIGSPHVEGASVTAKVIDHGRAQKVVVIKKKRRKDYRRKNGHRQPFTTLQIVSISS